MWFSLFPYCLSLFRCVCHEPPSCLQGCREPHVVLRLGQCMSQAPCTSLFPSLELSQGVIPLSSNSISPVFQGYLRRRSSPWESACGCSCTSNNTSGSYNLGLSNREELKFLYVSTSVGVFSRYTKHIMYSVLLSSLSLLISEILWAAFTSFY